MIWDAIVLVHYDVIVMSGEKPATNRGNWFSNPIQGHQTFTEKKIIQLISNGSSCVNLDYIDWCHFSSKFGMDAFLSKSPPPFHGHAATQQVRRLHMTPGRSPGNYWVRPTSIIHPSEGPAPPNISCTKYIAFEFETVAVTTIASSTLKFLINSILIG